MKRDCDIRLATISDRQQRQQEEVAMVRPSTLTAFFCLYASISTAQSESNCVALLQHGIYDHIRETSSGGSASQNTSAFCNSYSSWRQSSSGGGGGLSIPGVGGLSGSYSREQAEAIASLVCSNSSSSASATSAATLAQDKINAEAVQAWRQCVALNSVGLRSKTEYREADLAQLTLELWYVQQPGSPADTRIEEIIIDPPDAMQCAGTLVSAARGRSSIRTNSVAMSCSRQIPQTTFTLNGRPARAGASSVTVITRSGTLTRYFAPIYDSPAPLQPVLPIGSIIPFSGSVDDAVALSAQGWWLCDGRTITDSLSPLNGRATPRLTDRRFLVGAESPGESGGSNAIRVPSRSISTKVSSFEAGTHVSLPPTMNVIAESWRMGAPIITTGTLPEAVIDFLPQYYSVLYLIKAR